MLDPRPTSEISPWRNLIISLFDKHYSTMILVGFSCLIANTKAQAQTREEAQKRAFAELLARRATAVRADSRREEPATDSLTERRTAQSEVQAQSTASILRRMHSTSPFFAPDSPLGASSDGVASASPVVPTRCVSPRVAFVDELYRLILGRTPAEQEERYWARLLVMRGARPIGVAESIWRSREHRTLVREHKAPGIPFEHAYRRSYAYAKARGRW
jgi:hypothetical protein